ncbi:ThiF family adenylyltransferase [Corynebacterium sp. YIM 101645]|uniref:ThiF family adenylyltransferase n=1 Tax=Corynebacterium lemuris TaxID=1859292 RepID=A0ABT2FZD0_9CORY|nr:ThiF family adenylyltransferase [Corynebacterium lemuris]MCS5480615.1 ThiF family adenylyltransferase [Corynebacterium lemuris]
MPWLDSDDFLQMIQRWIEESATGWQGDLPVLDLDRYFSPGPAEPLIIYDNLDKLNNKFVQLRREKTLTRVIGVGAIPRRAAKKLKSTRAFAYVTSIGQPEVPPRNWEDIKALLPTSDARAIDVGIREQRLSYLILKYERGGLEAVLTLRAWATKSGAITLAKVESASHSREALSLRAGPRTTELSNSRLVVIGAGAIGSFLCDQLARSGVGEITIYDPDEVRPGNLVRHLTSAEMVGKAKPHAVREVITSRPFNISTIIVKNEPAPTPREVLRLFVNADLVIDASAAGGTTALLAKAAEASGHHLLTVCLQEDGQVVRVDVVPPLEGPALPPTQLGPLSDRRDLKFEAGCGDPVSMTPPFAVLEAASLAARCAIGMLLNEPVCKAGIVRDYR